MTERITIDNVPPNIRRLAAYIQTRHNPKKVTEALIAYLERMSGNGKSQ